MESINNHSLTTSSFWKNFLNFDRFITGTVLKIIYFIGVILIILATIAGGLMYLGTLLMAVTNFSLSGILVALFLFIVNLIVGALLMLILRVYCELIMVIFKINENLQVIRDKNGSV